MILTRLRWADGCMNMQLITDGHFHFPRDMRMLLATDGSPGISAILEKKLVSYKENILEMFSSSCLSSSMNGKRLISFFQGFPCGGFFLLRDFMVDFFH